MYLKLETYTIVTTLFGHLCPCVLHHQAGTTLSVNTKTVKKADFYNHYWCWSCFIAVIVITELGVILSRTSHTSAILLIPLREITQIWHSSGCLWIVVCNCVSYAQQKKNNCREISRMYRKPMRPNSFQFVSQGRAALTWRRY